MLNKVTVALCVAQASPGFAVGIPSFAKTRAATQNSYELQAQSSTPVTTTRGFFLSADLWHPPIVLSSIQLKLKRCACVCLNTLWLRCWQVTFLYWSVAADSTMLTRLLLLINNEARTFRSGRGIQGPSRAAFSHLHTLITPWYNKCYNHSGCSSSTLTVGEPVRLLIHSDSSKLHSTVNHYFSIS